MSETNIDVIHEVEQNFIDSSYDVNAHRAFPSVKDGLKDGARAILWAMHKMKLSSSKPHVKSAKVDGYVAGNFWPHSNTSIYETFVHMSQPFGMNCPEVDFHGNNGNSIIGDAPASDRYTEVRLAKLTEKFVLDGVEKDCVPMQLNYLEEEEWPVVMPSVFPNLLVNGSQGIGVSISQTFLPHNLAETCDLLTFYLSSGVLNEDTYFPDFPTGGTIINKSSLAAINKTGKGAVVLQAAYEVKDNKIIFTALPYQIYVEDAIAEIRAAIEEGKIDNIVDVYNSSDKNGLGLTVECNSPSTIKPTLDQLFQYTHLRNTYHANQNAIVSKTPVLLHLKEVVDYYIEFNLDCIKKMYEYDSTKIQERIEMIEGYLKAIANIDDCIKIIKHSDNPKDELKEKFSFSDKQVAGILGMRLSTLSHLENEKLERELAEKRETLAAYKEILESEEKRKEILINKLNDMKNEFGEPRKSEVTDAEIVKTTSRKCATAPTELVISLSSSGYVNKLPVTEYSGRHDQAVKIMSDELVLIFTDKGKCYRVSPKDIKPISKEKGQPFGNIVKLQEDEHPILLVDNKENTKYPYIIFVSEDGHVKKTLKTVYIGRTRNLRGLSSVPFQYAIPSNGNILSMRTSDGFRLDVKCDTIRTTKSGRGRIGIRLHDGAHIKDVQLLSPQQETEYLGSLGHVGKKI